MLFGQEIGYKQSNIQNITFPPGIVHLLYVHMRAVEERKRKHSVMPLVMSQRKITEF